MTLAKLLRLLRQYEINGYVNSQEYTVRVEQESLIITKHTDVDEIEVNKEY